MASPPGPGGSRTRGTAAVLCQVLGNTDTHTHTQATSLEVMSCLQLRKYIDPICIHQCKPRYQHRHQVEHEKGIPKGYHWSSGQTQRVFPSQMNYLVGEFDDTLGYSYIYLGFSEVIHHFSSVQRKLHRRL